MSKSKKTAAPKAPAHCTVNAHGQLESDFHWQDGVLVHKRSGLAPKEHAAAEKAAAKAAGK